MIKQVSALVLCAIILISAQAFAGKVEVEKQPPSMLTKKVSIELKDQPLVDAVKMLFKDMDVSVKVDAEVAPLKVTAVLKNVSVMDALNEIVRAAGAQAFSQAGVWHISPVHPSSSMAVELQRKIADLVAELAKERASKSEDHPSVKALQNAIEALQKRLGQEWDHVSQMGLPGTPNWYFANPSAAGKGGKTQIFVIKYINPAELVPLVYAIGARQATVVSGGKLVVNGTEEVIKQAADMVSQLDTEEALPRPVTVRIQATYLVTDEAGKTESLASFTSGTVAEGQPIKLSTVAAPKNDEFLPGLLLDVQLLPEVVSGDQVTLVGKVVLPAPEKPDIKLADTPVAVTVKSGSSAVISEGSFDLSGGKLEFEIKAEVTVGKERLKTRTKGGFGGGGGGGGSLIAPGLGGYQGMGGFGGDSECFDPTQWSAAFDAYGQNMAQFGAAMEAAAAQWQKAFDGLGGGGGFGGLDGETGGYGGQQDEAPDCPSGGGGGF